MSFYLPNSSDPVYVFKRQGTPSDPFVPKSETKKIANNKTILTELPDFFTKVQVSVDGVSLNETQSKTPTINQYYVDYSQGYVIFHPSREGQNVALHYMGVGLTTIPTSRIYTESDGTVPSKTLKDKLEDIVSQIGSGSGGGSVLSYSTLSQLQVAYPNGINQPAWITSENAWYYWSGVADTTPPNNVTSLQTSNITASGVTLSWTASSSSDVASYDIYRGSTFVINVSGTSYNISGLTAETAYTFSVRAKDSSGNVASGTTVNVTTAQSSGGSLPSNVTNLSASNPTQTAMTISWTGASGATSYDIERNGAFLANVTGTTYNVTGLVANTSYTFTIKAKNANGSASGASITQSTLVESGGSSIANVTNLRAENIALTSITLRWTLSTSSSITAYDIYRNDVLIQSIGASLTEYQVTGLTHSTQYTFKVVTRSTNGTTSTGATIAATTEISTSGNPAISGYSLFLNNPSNLTTIDNPNNYFIDNQAFSFSITAKSPTQSRVFYRWVFGEDASNKIFLETTANSEYRLTLFGKNTSNQNNFNPVLVTTPIPTVLSDFQHITVTRGATDLKIYINGVLDKTLTTNMNVFSFNVSPETKPLVLGQSGKAFVFKNLTYYAKELTAQEVLENYNVLK